jgi:hypothetical protein
VSFYWGESDESESGTVPLVLTEDISPFYKCMKGTGQKPARCAALQGQVGIRVKCSIYALRSTTCREFGIDWHNGAMRVEPEELNRCNQARFAWGLSRLEIQPSRFVFDKPGSHVHHRRMIYAHLTHKGLHGGHKAGGIHNT